MSAADSIYNFRGILDREFSKLSQDKYNGLLLLKYYKSRVAEGLSQARVVKCIITLRQLSQMHRKPFESASKDDIIELIAGVERRDFSEWTKHDHKVILKKFYQWLRGSDPEQKTEQPHETESWPNELTEEDVEEINRLVKEEGLFADERNESVELARDNAETMHDSASGSTEGEADTEVMAETGQPAIQPAEVLDQLQQRMESLESELVENPFTDTFLPDALESLNRADAYVNEAVESLEHAEPIESVEQLPIEVMTPTELIAPPPYEEDGDVL